MYYECAFISKSFSGSNIPPAILRNNSDATEESLEATTIESSEEELRQVSPMKEFFLGISPIDYVNWHRLSLINKIYEIVKVSLDSNISSKRRMIV